MVKNRILFALWLVLWLVLWALGKSTMPLCILLGSVAAAAVELACAALAAKRLHMTLHASLSAQKGEAQEVCLQAENDGALTCAVVSARVECRNLLTDERTEQSLRFSLAGRQKRSLPVPFAPARCGKLAISIAELRLYDLLGLYGRKLPCEERCFSLVLPELYPVQVQLGRNYAVELDSNEYSMRRPGDDPSETFALREYVPGDQVRNIHWKLTEKTGEVIVRQLGLPVNRSLLLLMDNSAPFGCTAADREALGEMTASVSAALCSVGFAHQVAWYDRTLGSIATVGVESEDTLTRALAELLAAQIVPDEKTALEHYHACCGAPAYARVVVLTLRTEAEFPLGAEEETVTVLHAGAEAVNREEGIYLAI